MTGWRKGRPPQQAARPGLGSTAFGVSARGSGSDAFACQVQDRVHVEMFLGQLAEQVEAPLSHRRERRLAGDPQRLGQVVGALLVVLEGTVDHGPCHRAGLLAAGDTPVVDLVPGRLVQS